MKTNMLTRVRGHFNCASRQTNRFNQRAWIRSVRLLGDKWLLAHPINRIPE